MFPRIEYLEWIEDRIDAATYDFGTSDLTRQNDGMVQDELRPRDESTANRSLEAQIASRYDPDVSAENVLVTAGATMANVVVLATVLDLEETVPHNGNHVVVEDPAYEPLHKTARGMGATVDQFSRDQSFRVKPGAIENATTDETSLVVLTNRHNPSGRLTPRVRLEEVASSAVAGNTQVLVDEVYAPYESTPRTGPGTALGGVTAGGLENTLVTNSLTKFFGYGSLRIGWLVGPEAFVERARSMTKHFPTVAGTSRRLARGVFENYESIVDRSRVRIEENHDLLTSFLEDRDNLEGFVSPGSTLAFLTHDSIAGDELAATALDSGVLVVPGRFFDRPGYVRLALGKPPGEMREGLNAFGAVLDSLSDTGSG